MARTLQTYFAKLKQAKIEADYDYQQFSLNRALEAVIDLRVTQQLGDEQGFLQATMDYKRAILGIASPENDYELKNRAENGSIGFLEKVGQKSGVGEQFDAKNKDHKALKIQGIELAKLLNTHAIQRVEQAVKTNFIETGYLSEPYDKADKLRPKPLQQMLGDIDKSLSSAQQQAIQQVTIAPKPTPSRGRGPGF